MPGGQLLSAVTWRLVSHGAVQVPTAGSSTGGGWTRPGRVGDCHTSRAPAPPYQPVR